MVNLREGVGLPRCRLGGGGLPNDPAQFAELPSTSLPPPSPTPQRTPTCPTSPTIGANLYSVISR
jgi:hypothetical protein